MGKQSGLGDNLYVSGYNYSGDIGSIGRIGGGPTPLIVTGIDKSGQERIGGLIDGAIEYNGFFNPDEGRAHERLSLLPTGNQLLSYCRGTGLGSPGAGLVAKQVNYDPTRGQDGSITFAISAQSAGGWGLEWGRQGTAGVRSDTTATNGASIDDSASSAHGLSAYLHVFSFTGTSVTVKLQQSSDNGGADAWTDVVGGGFTAATGVTSQRIATANDLAVERYLRVVTTGTFSAVTFAVLICRNEIEPGF
ncbi:hypothetical protein [Herbidospora daliensis]|uniref:hypothetical protein n=1 Tax=Herbidospora daliensis TaxID=295585 RepID=UPI000783F6CD|nr:hypothetical protein [Herbidospora daliensis]